MKHRIILPGSAPLALLPLAVIFFSVACGTVGPTRLCENFESYETMEAVRAELSQRGAVAGWEEQSQGTSPADRRPPYRITYLRGPLKLSGFDGQLKFTFYNGRLMETQFSPRKGNEYIEALRSGNSRVPEKPGEEIVTDRRTRFRFDVGPDGTFSFTWYDPKLENEWMKWVASNS